MPSRAPNGSITRLLSGESNRQVALLTSGDPSLSAVLTEAQRHLATLTSPWDASLGVGRKMAVTPRGIPPVREKGYTPGPESQSLRVPELSVLEAKASGGGKGG